MCDLFATRLARRREGAQFSGGGFSQSSRPIVGSKFPVFDATLLPLPRVVTRHTWQICNNTPCYRATAIVIRRVDSACTTDVSTIDFYRWKPGIAVDVYTFIYPRHRGIPGTIPPCHIPVLLGGALIKKKKKKNRIGKHGARARASSTSLGFAQSTEISVAIGRAVTDASHNRGSRISISIIGHSICVPHAKRRRGQLPACGSAVYFARLISELGPRAIASSNFSQGRG